MSQQEHVLIKRDAYRTVQRFCEWSMNRRSPSQSVQHDIAVLLTRENLGPAGGHIIAPAGSVSGSVLLTSAACSASSSV